MQSRTHIEEMVINMETLFRHAFPDIWLDHGIVNATPFITRMRLLGCAVHEHGGIEILDPPDRMWISDTVRGWCAMSIGYSGHDLAKVLVKIRRYAADPHFAVREWSWLAVRSHIVRDPEQALSTLSVWCNDKEPLLRRFAIEATRPKSVWGAHIQLFKQRPEVADAYLRTMICDPDTNVQDAVSNWVNDAARSRPDWTQSTAESWAKDCDCKATRRIVSRARRNLKAP